MNILKLNIGLVHQIYEFIFRADAFAPKPLPHLKVDSLWIVKVLNNETVNRPIHLKIIARYYL